MQPCLLLFHFLEVASAALVIRKLCLTQYRTDYNEAKTMFPFLETYLRKFRGYFTREATFKWFVIIIIGLMQRTDHLRITSVIRELCLDGNLYKCYGIFSTQPDGQSKTFV